MVKAPYGEGRRLAYFRVITDQAEKFLPCDITFLVDQILHVSKKMHNALLGYKRTTGRMENKNVCYNYLRFSSWLSLLKIEGDVVSRNANTVFFSTLEHGQNFNLSKDEKLAYFIHLWFRIPKLREVLGMLSTYRPLRSGKLRTLGITEHTAETYSEWLVDLDLANATRRGYGAYYLNAIGDKVRSLGETPERACCTYASSILAARVEPKKCVSEDYAWREIARIAKNLSRHIASPVDPRLVAALPILSHLQIALLNKRHTFLTREELIVLAQEASDSHEATFTWDRAYKTGYLEFR